MCITAYARFFLTCEHVRSNSLSISPFEISAGIIILSFHFQRALENFFFGIFRIPYRQTSYKSKLFGHIKHQI